MLKLYFGIYLIYRALTGEPEAVMISDYDAIIKRAVATHLPGYDWRLYKAQLWQESRLKPNAVSAAGAGGIAQFMQPTWEDYAEKAGYKGSSRFDAEASIMTGAYYMAYLIGEWHVERPDVDRHCLAMASFNAGLGNILKAQKLAGDPSLYAPIINKLPDVTGEHSRETISYVRKILNYCSGLVTGELSHVRI